MKLWNTLSYNVRIDVSYNKHLWFKTDTINHCGLNFWSTMTSFEDESIGQHVCDQFMSNAMEMRVSTQNTSYFECRHCKRSAYDWDRWHPINYNDFVKIADENVQRKEPMMITWFPLYCCAFCLIPDIYVLIKMFSLFFRRHFLPFFFIIVDFVGLSCTWAHSEIE